MRRDKPSRGVGRELPQHPSWRRAMLIEARFHPPQRTCCRKQQGRNTDYKVVRDGATNLLWA